MKSRSSRTMNSNIRDIYDRRALQYAKKNKKNDQRDVHSYIVFKLQNEQFGISLSDCQRVLNNQKISPVPFTASYIKGILHYHGHLIATIDLLKLLGYSSTNISPDQSVIVVKDRRAIFCLLVDQVVGPDKYSEKELGIPLSEASAENKKYITGIHHGKVAIIDTAIIIDELLISHANSIG